jgi:hypothetical protein
MGIVRRTVAGLVAMALLAGCATVRVAGRHPAAAPGDGGGVRVRVFADDDARKAGRVLDGSLSGALERHDGKAWTPLFRSLDPSWTVAGLAHGRYRVRFDAALDATGEAKGLEHPVTEAVEVRDGEIVEVEVILDHVSPAMVAAGAAAVVVAAVLLHEWLDDVDLPTPPPPPAWLVDTVFWVTLDVATTPSTWMPRVRAPQVTSHFPRSDDLVAAPRVRVVFALSEPIDPDSLAEDAVQVGTADGTLLRGTVAWDARRWWVTWTPAEDLPRAETLTATLAAEGLTDPQGNLLAASASFRFRTAR